MLTGLRRNPGLNGRVADIVATADVGDRVGLQIRAINYFPVRMAQDTNVYAIRDENLLRAPNAPCKRAFQQVRDNEAGTITAHSMEADFLCGCTVRRSDGSTRLSKGTAITVILCCGCKIEANAKRQTHAQACKVHSDRQLDAVHMYDTTMDECGF
jgi:hypothetical protein